MFKNTKPIKGYRKVELPVHNKYYLRARLYAIIMIV